MLSNIPTSDWFTDSGLVTEIVFKIAFISILSPIIYLMNPIGILKWTTLFIEKKKGDKSKMS